jgi:hypothetical protein
VDLDPSGAYADTVVRFAPYRRLGLVSGARVGFTPEPTRPALPPFPTDRPPPSWPQSPSSDPDEADSTS